jgi:enterochelin esterase family protein
VAAPRRQQDGLLIEQLKAGEKPHAGCALSWRPGATSRLFSAPIRRFTPNYNTQQTVFWRQVDGGHDALCWRGGLTQGLMTLWQPLIQ